MASALAKTLVKGFGLKIAAEALELLLGGNKPD
jgi:hypothetical protein